MERGRRAELRERFERAVELPLLLLALAMVPLVVVPLLVDLPPAVEQAFVAADWFVWAAFAFEYVVRLALADRRLRFVRQEWPDLLIVVLPLLRPLRLVRSARALHLLRLVRVVAALAEVQQSARRILARHHLHYVLVFTGVVMLGSAALALAFESGGGGAIDSFGDALWWAVTTVTTVGYGDMFPVTPAGRAVGAVLMAVGITLFGFLTANLASVLIENEQPNAPDTAAQPAKPDRLDEVLDRLAAIERRLDALRAPDA